MSRRRKADARPAAAPPVLGIDLGTGTVAAALSINGQPAEPLMMNVRKHPAPHYRAEVIVDDDGEPCAPGRAKTVAHRVRNITRFLGQPPTVIGGTPRGINTLMETLLRPAMEAADREAGQHVTHLAVTHPTHWPGYIVDAYENVLTDLGYDVRLILASEAISAVADDFATEGVVTCLNMGETAATLTLARKVANGRYPLVHRADPRGGRRYADATLVAEIAQRLDANFRPTSAWLEEAVPIGRAIRNAANSAPNLRDLIQAQLPAPFGLVKFAAGGVADLVEDHVANTLRRLVGSDDVQEVWETDESYDIPRTLLVAGGFSTDKAVGRAIRTQVAPWHEQDHPEAAQAMGAADLMVLLMVNA